LAILGPNQASTPYGVQVRTLAVRERTHVRPPPERAALRTHRDSPLSLSVVQQGPCQPGSVECAGQPSHRPTEIEQITRKPQ